MYFVCALHDKQQSHGSYAYAYNKNKLEEKKQTIFGRFFLGSQPLVRGAPKSFSLE